MKYGNAQDKEDNVFLSTVSDYCKVVSISGHIYKKHTGEHRKII